MACGSQNRLQLESLPTGIPMADRTATKQTAGPGAIGGATGDSGVEYRRGVAAYAVSCGLSGRPLSGFGVPALDAQVRAVALETEEALDDLRVEFVSGWKVLVQAKRTLCKGAAFEKAVAQWVEAAKGQLDPGRDRLMLVGREVKGAAKTLSTLLKQAKNGIPAVQTKKEAESWEYLKGLLGDLTEDQSVMLFKCAVILELKVEEIDDTHSLLGIEYLTNVVASRSTDEARSAWSALVAESGRLARQRSGDYMDGWLEALRTAGIALSHVGNTPSAEIVRLNQAIDLYKKRIIDAGTCISLHGLAADLPPIPFDEVDAKVLVAHGDDGADVGYELLWAFLRRGRLILTGLPGSGKSTALKHLAAQLVNLPGGPLPICVALRDVDALPKSDSFRERVLSAAVVDLSESDKPLVKADLDRRLHDGNVAILFDSLDETYDRRHEVVRQLDEFMDDVSEDVDALLSTREIAYSSAKMLEWPSLPLRAPDQIEQTIETLLRRKFASRTHESTSDENSEWISERMAWVTSALRDDSTLRETPLVPVLLTLLAAEKNFDVLPKGRAHVLHAVIQNVLERYEIKKREGIPVGSLNGTQVTTGVLRAFACESSAILDNNGEAGRLEVLTLIASDLKDYWGWSQGPADSTARDIVHFLDESGIFVISGEDEIIAPRITLLAEVGDAVSTKIMSPADVESWVNKRIASNQLEPVVLAAALHPQVAKQFFDLAAKSGEHLLLKAAVQAKLEGAPMQEIELRDLCHALIENLRSGTREGWDSLAQLLRLPVPIDLHADVENASNIYGESRVKLARAQLQLRYFPENELVRAPEALIDILAIKDLPDLIGADSDSSRDSLLNLLSTNPLKDVQLQVARILLGKVPEVTPLVMQLAAEDRGRGATRGFKKALMEAGLAAEADELPEEPLIQPSPLFDGIINCDYRSFLQRIADRPSTELNYQQRARVSELADLLETLAMNEGGSHHLVEDPELSIRTVGLIESLYNFDPQVIAAQAALTIQRMDSANSDEPYWALFDLAKARTVFAWDDVQDTKEAVSILGELLAFGRSHRLLACRVLLEAPPELSVPKLREVLLKINSPDAQRLVSRMVAGLGNGPEPESWLSDPNPVLRVVAAEYCELAGDNTLSPQHTLLLSDSDGFVRAAALEQAIKLNPKDLEGVLQSFHEQMEVGWMCFSCRTINPPRSRSCIRKKKCFGTAPKFRMKV